MPKSRGHRYEQPADHDADAARRGANHMRDARNNLRASLRDPASTNPNTTAGATTDAGVDRNTSVRSVMTLPAYRLDASEHEQVLGREGERGGIDVVVELPTAEDEEALREEEMETLYQIRLARRRQIEEREERRQRRREARARNDAVALEELRRARARGGEDAEATGSAEAVQELRREHERIKETRQRAVSSVSYHEVGLVRADGTRLRANSNESERVGLLSDAASIAPSARSASGGSGLGLFGHRRDRSASSVISIDTAGNGHSPPGSPLLTTGDSAGGGGGNNNRSGPTTPRAGSSPEMIDAADADLGDADMPPHSPPGYDDVSLDELTPAHSRESTRSGANSPYNEPPPDYPGGGPTQMRNHRLSAQMAGLAASAATEGEEEAEGSAGRRGSRGVGGVPQLPSLRLTSLPRIVVEPSTATPGEDER